MTTSTLKVISKGVRWFDKLSKNSNTFDSFLYIFHHPLKISIWSLAKKISFALNSRLNWSRFFHFNALEGLQSTVTLLINFAVIFFSTAVIFRIPCSLETTLKVYKMKLFSKARKMENPRWSWGFLFRTSHWNFVDLLRFEIQKFFYLHFHGVFLERVPIPLQPFGAHWKARSMRNLRVPRIPCYTHSMRNFLTFTLKFQNFQLSIFLHILTRVECVLETGLWWVFFLSCPQRTFFYVIRESIHLVQTVKNASDWQVLNVFRVVFCENFVNKWEYNSITW